MTTRHLNCKPMSIVGDKRPAVSMSGQTKRGLRAEIERQTEDFIAQGNEIKRLDSQQASTITRPAFNDMPAEYEAA